MRTAFIAALSRRLDLPTHSILLPTGIPKPSASSREEPFFRRNEGSPDAEALLKGIDARPNQTVLSTIPTKGARWYLPRSPGKLASANPTNMRIFQRALPTLTRTLSAARQLSSQKCLESANPLSRNRL